MKQQKQHTTEQEIFWNTQMLEVHMADIETLAARMGGDADWEIGMPLTRIRGAIADVRQALERLEAQRAPALAAD